MRRIVAATWLRKMCSIPSLSKVYKWQHSVFMLYFQCPVFFELGLYVWLALLSYYGWDWNIIHSLCILITFMVSWILCGPLIGELASQAKHCFLNNGIKSKVVHVNISASLNWQHRCKTEPVQSPPAFIPAPVEPQIRWMWLFVRTVEPLVILLSYMYNALVLS